MKVYKFDERELPVHPHGLRPVLWRGIPCYFHRFDSKAWVKNKKCNTGYHGGEKLQRVIKRAEEFLQNNDFKAEKWLTRLWGENPADYGNK